MSDSNLYPSAFQDSFIDIALRQRVVAFFSAVEHCNRVFLLVLKYSLIHNMLQNFVWLILLETRAKVVAGFNKAIQSVRVVSVFSNINVAL